MRAPAHLRRHRCHVVTEQRREPPSLRDMAIEAVALVLREHHDLEITGVGEVRQDEIDDAVGTAERHRGLGPVVRERCETPTLTAGQDDDEDIGRALHCGQGISAHPRAGHGQPTSSSYIAMCWQAGSRHDQSAVMPRRRIASRRGRFAQRARGAVKTVDEVELAGAGHDHTGTLEGSASMSTTVSCRPPTSVTMGRCHSAWPASAPGRKVRSGSA